MSLKSIDDIKKFFALNKIQCDSIEVLVFYFLLDVQEFDYIPIEKINKYKPQLNNFQNLHEVLENKKQQIYSDKNQFRLLFFYAFDLYSLEQKYFTVSLYVTISNFILQQQYIQQRKKFYQFLNDKKVHKLFIDDCKYSLDMFEQLSKDKEMQQGWPRILQQYINQYLENSNQYYNQIQHQIQIKQKNKKNGS